MSAPAVQLAPWGEGDLDELRRENTPEMTALVGGPESDDALEARLAKYLRLNASGEARMRTIRVEGERDPVGSVGAWHTEWRGAAVWECGWKVLPGWQGRGIATAATRLVIAEVRAHPEGGRERLYAYPMTVNMASNALCRRLGFALEGEFDVPDRDGTGTVRVNAWWSPV